VRRAVYAGSFDPPTNGHMFMIREGARLFDELVVAIGVNPDKRSTFTVEKRLELLRAVTRELRGVRIETFEHQYLVKYAASIGADYILRGIRNAADFEYERTMRHVNQDMVPGVTTVFLIPPRQLAETSSSFVKGLVGPRGWREVVREFVPPPVFEAILGLYPPDERGGQDGD
jgi:pantetheine-phosphate adenylyltransferase